jgi:hypothetical protein
MPPKNNRSGQYLRTDADAAVGLADRYDRPQVKLSSQSAVSPQPPTEEESERWLAQQMFEHYNS